MSKTERALDAEALDTDDVEEFDDGVRAADDTAAPSASPFPPPNNGNGHIVAAGDPLVTSAVDRSLSEPSEEAADASDEELDRLDGLGRPEGRDGSVAAVESARAPHVESADVEDRPEALVGPEPSEDVLEELRRAEIDGPMVKMAPQDDTTAARRRPRRLPEYDPAPIPIPTKVPRVLGRKPRVRKVTRVVRSVDPWSVFKIALVASLVLYVIAITSGVLLWNVAYATGTIDNVERFFESFGWSSFEFNGGEIYHSAWIGGLFAALGLTGLAVLGAALFNLITDLVGGVRLTVLEEEVVESRTSPMRRFVVRRPAPEIPAVEDDESGSLVREAIVDDSGAIIRRTR